MKPSTLFRLFSVLAALALTLSLPVQAQKQTDSFSELRDFGFDSAMQGWVLLDGRLFRTTDGGSTWTEITPEPSIAAVTFLEQTGWAVLIHPQGDRVSYSLAATQNRGDSWSARPITLFAAEQAWVLPKSVHIHFEDAQRGRIIVQHVTSANFNLQSIFETIDGGGTWKQTENAVEKSLTEQTPKDSLQRRDMLSASLGWGMEQRGDCMFDDPVTKQGADCAQQTRLVRTTDGGASWQTIPLPQTPNGILERQIPVADTPEIQPSLAYTQTWAGQGVDICEIPSLSKLQTWWSNSPYAAVNLYIGGSSRACANVNLTKAFLVQLHLQGWKFIPTWVGPQAPCTGYSLVFPYNTTDAYDEGVTQAAAALFTAYSLGLTESNGSGTVIYYDLEAYDTSNTSCKNAALAFIHGWTDQMEAVGDVSALYGASCASALTDVGNLVNPPDAIWIANWYPNYVYNPSATVWNTACLANSYWPNHQRIRQYTGGHNETWGGVTINVDSNVLDGVVAIPVLGLVSDAFTSATAISSTPYMDAQSIGLATNEANDPVLPCATGQGFNTVWYQVTPAASGRMLVSTRGSSYDTVLAVWTGAQGSLTNQACNDNFNGIQSEVQMEVNAGTAYFIEVASPSAVPSGTLVLSVFQPVQDDFNGAVTLAPQPSTVSLDTSTTGISSDDPAIPACSLGPGSNTVWYQFTPSVSGPVSIDTFSSTYDTTLAVWMGARGALTPVACNDDTAGGQQSQVDLALTAGTTYYVEISQFSGNLSAPQAAGGGTLALHLTSFHDVPGNYWSWKWIEALFASGITGGCSTSPMSYCPETEVTRAQMAVFLERGMRGSTFIPPNATGTTFLDVPADHWAGGWIEQLFADGITGGCGNGNYCPDLAVTRAQMAVFLLRAEHGSTYQPPDVGADTGFADVPVDYWSAAWIKQLAAEGITGGCGNGNYCPEQAVTRAQMAVFLTRTFNLPLP